MVQKHSQISSPFANFADHPLVFRIVTVASKLLIYLNLTHFWFFSCPFLLHFWPLPVYLCPLPVPEMTYFEVSAHFYSISTSLLSILLIYLILGPFWSISDPFPAHFRPISGLFPVTSGLQKFSINFL